MKHKLPFLLLLLSGLLSAQVAKVGTLLGQNNQLALPPGGLNSTYSLTVMNNEVYFSARTDSPNNGFELFKSNGQNNNLVLVRDINTSLNNYSSSPKNFAYNSFSNEIYFSADDAPAPGDDELFKSDGTTSGTTKVFDFNSNGDGSPRRFKEFNNKMFFAVTGTNTGEELGFSDGTSSGSGIIEIQPGTTGSEPQNFAVFNGELYFSAETSTGRELWKTDGTTVGTVLVKDINTSGDSNPEQLIEYNNKLYFVADNGTSGKELWESNGTNSGTQIVSDLNSGSDGSNPTDLTVYKGRLYLSAITAATGREIYRVGTGGGISILRDIVIGATGCNAEKFFYYSDKNLLLFVAGNGNSNKELWYTDGSLVFTNQLKDINPGTNSSSINNYGSMNYSEYNGKVYFSANDGTNGDEIWVTDGTTSGTQLLENIHLSNLSSYPRSLVVTNGLLFFIAGDSYGYELWKYKDPSLSVEEITRNDIFSLFPNPANTSFSVETNQIIESIDIYNVQGCNVKSFKSELSDYDITNLTSGIYFVKIKSDNNEFTKKIIKQ